MAKQLPSIRFATCIAALLLIGLPTAQAKQQCRAEVPPNAREYWSWRIIDGRRCWYEGRPMLSKSLLEWPAPASTQSDRELEGALTEKSRDPMDAKAWAPADRNTFDALWRARVERR